MTKQNSLAYKNGRMRLHPAIYYPLFLFRRPAEAAFDSAGKRVDARRSCRTAAAQNSPLPAPDALAARSGAGVRSRCRSGSRRWCSCRRQEADGDGDGVLPACPLPREGMPPRSSPSRLGGQHLAGAVATRDGVRKRCFDLAFLRYRQEPV